VRCSHSHGGQRIVLTLFRLCTTFACVPSSSPTPLTVT
jgi:hypothetical protein